MHANTHIADRLGGGSRLQTSATADDVVCGIEMRPQASIWPLEGQLSGCIVHVAQHGRLHWCSTADVNCVRLYNHWPETYLHLDYAKSNFVMM